jgi:hypothetical protein
MKDFKELKERKETLLKSRGLDYQSDEQFNEIALSGSMYDKNNLT